MVSGATMSDGLLSIAVQPIPYPWRYPYDGIREAVLLTSPYGTWRSEITGELAAASLISFDEITTLDGSLYWLELRPTEKGRSVLVKNTSGEIHDLIPRGYSARTRIHEYGGGSYCIGNSKAWFVNHSDQNIYSADVVKIGTPVLVRGGDESERFGDLTYDHIHNRLIAIRENHSIMPETLNELVSVSCVNGSVTTLHSGHDFYASPRISMDGSRLAFIAWDHPNMPWDGTQLYVCELDKNGLVCREAVIAGGLYESIVQPEWLDSKRLLYLSDQSGYWNFFSYDDSGVRAITEDEAEYGGPMWTCRSQYYAPLDNNYVAAVRVIKGISELVIVDLTTGLVTPCHACYSSYRSVNAASNSIIFVAGSVKSASSIVRYEVKHRITHRVAHAGILPVNQDYFAEPEQIEFCCNDGTMGYAYFYPPTHPYERAERNELPPLLVLAHGGPTLGVSPDLSMRIQLYTSRGWSVVDVNYGGSTGYGRDYRNRLCGQWGVIDVQDCAAAARHLIALGRADAQRVAIRGGSAGGYTTLMALCTSSAFTAGSIYYGVADLQLLASSTHKFESRYLNRLVHPKNFGKRSPINNLDGLSAPVIFFQGALDKVVPPAQTETMFKAISKKGIPTAYFLFDDESHGFRVAENIERAVNAELIFLSKSFGIETTDLDLSVFEKAKVANFP